jgi:SAM-dependent methyltransferase
MNWKTKAFIQKAISKTPFARQLNYFLQRRVNRSLPMSNAVLDQKHGAARKHLTAFSVGDWDFDIDGLVYEFGAGCDLAIPIAFFDEGFKRQVVTDLNQLLKLDLVNYVLEHRGCDIELIKSISDLKQKTGIEYMPNIDAKVTSFETGSFNYIHSTDTLEHIPKNDILPILQECYRLLKAGGIISCIIDLQDHYQYADNSISPFNFYQFSWEEWNTKYNNTLHYQNRLLTDEYYSLFIKAGFAPIQMQVNKADNKQVEVLKQLNLHPDFAKKPIEEINNLRCHIWAEKPD